ncbi:hypothetical protein NBRC116493_12090 [Aurantivibrio infirmus]
MDGEIIARLGVQTYLDNKQARSTSNIDFFKTPEDRKIEWDQCNFGCHHPGYRVLDRPAKYMDVIKTLDSLSPFVAGLVDGSARTTYGLGKGVQRTGEGLGLGGMDKIYTVGAENQAIFNLAKDLLEGILSYDLNLVDNPLTQLIIKVVDTYMASIPHWVTEEAISQGKLIFEDTSALGLLKQAISKGLIPAMSDVEALDVVAMLSSAGVQRFAGKQIGKTVATRVATIIALTIATRLAVSIAQSKLYRNFIKIKVAGAKSPKGLTGVLVTLLQAQGFLGTAAGASRRLKEKCPQTWRYLRNSLNGIDMIYVFAEPFLDEFVARLSLLEKDPATFIDVTRKLIEAGKLNNIFLPHLYDKA